MATRAHPHVRRYQGRVPPPMRTSRISERVRSRRGGARSTATAIQLWRRLHTLVPVVPAFHVSGPLYNDLERSSWTMMPKHVVKTGLAFTIVVDCEHWFPLSGDQQTLARTEYMLVDARTPTWIVCERVWFRERTTNQEAVQTMGLEWDAQTYEKRPLFADASYKLTGRIASRWDFPLHEQDRMMHVVLGFVALLSHRKVAMTKTASQPGQCDHIRVEPPRSYSVERIVDDVNRRRHTR